MTQELRNGDKQLISCRNYNDTGTFRNSDILSFEIQTEDMDNPPYRALLEVSKMAGVHQLGCICVLSFSKGLESNPNVTLSDKDFEGPLSSTPTDEVDIYLILSSLFLLVFGCYMFVKSRYGRYVWETIDQIPWHRILHCFRREKRD